MRGNCWDIKEACPFKGTDPAKSACPVFAAQTVCWMFEWASFYKAMPGGLEKHEWKRMMLEGCAECEMRELHAREVDAFLVELRDL